MHPSARWLYLMCDLTGRKAERAGEFELEADTSPDGSVAVTLTSVGEEDFEIRLWNLDDKQVDVRRSSAGAKRTLVWRSKIEDANKPWVAIVYPKGDVSRCRDVIGWMPGTRLFDLQ